MKKELAKQINKDKIKHHYPNLLGSSGMLVSEKGASYFYSSENQATILICSIKGKRITARKLSNLITKINKELAK